MTNDDFTNNLGIFSQDEMFSTVKGFILAYMNKQVEIDFTKTLKSFGDGITTKFANMTPDEQIKEANKRRNNFFQLLEICSGVKPATKEVLDQSVRNFFRAILLFRLNGWLDGSFYDFAVNDKVLKLEQKLAQHDKIIHGYVNHLRESAGI